jgi:ATP adenylyltransferase
MDVKFAPWRMAYIMGEKKDGCIFCRDSIRKDDLILHEGTTCFVTMNLYPYNNGHLMVVPYRHISKLEELASEEKMEMFDLVDVSVRALRKVMKPDGFNIGMNLGRAAGAGVEDHLHMHVVPRWSGDTNYMSVVGEVRVIPDDLYKTRQSLLPHFRNLHPEEGQ